MRVKLFMFIRDTRYWPNLKDLFIRLNAPLPASAAVERLFSCAGLIMNDRHTGLTDKNSVLKVISWMETK